MSDFKKLRGISIQSVSSNPVNAVDGDVWYVNNTNTNAVNLRLYSLSGSWNAGGAMGTARCQLAGAGTNTSALAFGGFTTVAVACTESYNGSTWTAGGALATARCGLAGAGTNTAALAFGGVSTTTVACTESYGLIKSFSNFQE